MDIPRTLILIGLGVVAYLMVLAWNHDYHEATPDNSQVAMQSATSSQGSETSPSLSTTQGSLQGGNGFKTPEQNSQPNVSGGHIALNGETIEVKTDVLDTKINLVGGNVVQASLLKYDVSVHDKTPMLLLEHDKTRTYFLESALIGQDGFDSGKNGKPPVYKTPKQQYELAPGQNELQVNLTYTAPSGVKVVKQYIFSRGNYDVKLNYHIVNQSDKEWRGNFSADIVRDQSPDPSNRHHVGSRSFLGMILHTPADPYQKVSFDDLKEKPIDTSVKGGWIAFIQHYFLTAWIPDPNVQHQYQTTTRNGLHVMGFVSPETVVKPGGTANVGAQFYVGPKIIKSLEKIAPGLDRTVDYGFLFFIAHPLFIVLKWFHSVVGNWGVAIILLTVLIKAAFFQLSATSYRSMAKMRAVGPQMKRLRELYGDDRQRLSQEMMSLYKREKINPLGGCLPIAVQMPVFFSLYWVLYESVQLRQAPFFGWIQDLSVMDPYFILPILMGITMFVQMSLNPTPPDPMQAKVMKMMPFVFTIFFLWFPAGLVLYWLVNNLLSIGQQWLITKQIEKSTAKA
ncbi:membrane protein insertase YidC [Mangrovitalea sediminis]|uniref:membrane protein insertase YidC n=1 Tax=Mangrovitalea sediminis TaxID=1982043 RepID=UPI000BE52D6C|nr:membrane protein insertase YidC [Mangrovitalea sediminis]